MFFLLYSLGLSLSVQVPSSIPNHEKLEFYSNLEKFNYTVKYYKGKGLGLESKHSKQPDENVLCIPKDLHIRHTDPYPLSSYTQSLSSLNQLASRVLYEKFQSKKDSFARKFIGSIPESIPSSIHWSKASWDLLEKFSLFANISSGLDHSEDYLSIRNALKGLLNINKELIKDEAIDWAIRVVKTKSLRFIGEGNNEILVLSPYIDLVNYWYKPLESEGNSLYGKEDLICIKTPWGLNPGDEVVIDYGQYESSYFFTRYLFTIRNNPLDIIKFSLQNHKSNTISHFSLFASQINDEMLSMLMSSHDSSLSFDSDIKSFQVANPSKSLPILKSLVEYRKLFMQNSELPSKPGLRETLRQVASNEDESTILDFAVSSRQSIYNHYRAIDQEILHLLYNQIIKLSN